MIRRPIILAIRHGLRGSRLLQAGLIMAFWLAGEGLVRLLDLPVPGAILGLIAVLALLASGRISLLSMRRGAEWLLADMLLFFVPAVLAILDHHEFLGLMGVKILAVILVGTVIVMTVTALTVDAAIRMMARNEARNVALA